MPEGVARNWREILHACNLTVLDGEPPVSAPAPAAAIHYVAGVEAKSAFCVEKTQPAALVEVDRLWQTEVTERLADPGVGEFFVLPPGGGGASVGWVRVRGAAGIPLPSRVASVTGSPEFLTLTEGGSYLCAVTEEDEEYWIFIHRLRE